MKVDLTNKEFIGELINAKVSSVTINNGCEDGDNVAGSLKKIHIVKENGDEETIIFKHLPDEPPEWFMMMKIFRTEHAMYRTVGPFLKKFAESRGVTYEPPFAKYYTGFNNDKDDYIVLEDVRPSGYIMPDKRKSLTPPEMKLIMEEIAKFHAVSYALIKYEGMKIFETNEELMLLSQRPAEYSTINEKDPFDDTLQAYFEEVTKVIKTRDPEIGQRMEAIWPEAWKIRKTTVENREYFETLVHTDLWTNNIMIKHKRGQPVGVKFIDFQFCQLGNIFGDLQYLIFTSTTADFRKDHLISVLNIYFDTFNSTLGELKCPKPYGFSRTFFIEEFYKCFLPGFVHMAFAIALQLGDITSFEGDPATAPIDRVQKYYLQSPIALERFEAIAKECMQMKLI